MVRLYKGQKKTRIERDRFNVLFRERARVGKCMRMSVKTPEGKTIFEYWVYTGDDGKYLNFRRATMRERLGYKLYTAFLWWVTGGHVKHLTSKIK